MWQTNPHCAENIPFSTHLYDKVWATLLVRTPILVKQKLDGTCISCGRFISIQANVHTDCEQFGKKVKFKMIRVVAIDTILKKMLVLFRAGRTRWQTRELMIELDYCLKIISNNIFVSQKGFSQHSRTQRVICWLSCTWRVENQRTFRWTTSQMLRKGARQSSKTTVECQIILENHTMHMEWTSTNIDENLSIYERYFLAK